MAEQTPKPGLLAPFRSFYDSHLRASVEKWEPIIKYRMISFVLAPSQRIYSFNSWPFVTTLMLIYEIYNVTHTIGVLIDFFDQMHMSERVISIFSICFCVIAQALLAIPLEIAHGTLQTSVVLFLSYAYAQIVMRIISKDLYYWWTGPLQYGIVGMHLSNIVKNYTSFPQKHLRIIAVLVSILIVNCLSVYIDFETEGWKFALCTHTSLIGGLLLGFLTGYYWIYRHQEDDKPETKWKNYSIILTILASYLIVAELSELHISFAEYRARLQKRGMI